MRRLKQGRGSPTARMPDGSHMYTVTLEPQPDGAYIANWQHRDGSHDSLGIRITRQTVKRYLDDLVWEYDVPDCIMLPEGL